MDTHRVRLTRIKNNAQKTKNWKNNKKGKNYWFYWLIAATSIVCTMHSAAGGHEPLIPPYGGLVHTLQTFVNHLQTSTQLFVCFGCLHPGGAMSPRRSIDQDVRGSCLGREGLFISNRPIQFQLIQRATWTASMPLAPLLQRERDLRPCATNGCGGLVGSWQPLPRGTGLSWTFVFLSLFLRQGDSELDTGTGFYRG